MTSLVRSFASAVSTHTSRWRIVLETSTICAKKSLSSNFSLYLNCRCILWRHQITSKSYKRRGYLSHPPSSCWRKLWIAPVTSMIPSADACDDLWRNCYEYDYVTMNMRTYNTCMSFLLLWKYLEYINTCTLYYASKCNVFQYEKPISIADWIGHNDDASVWRRLGWHRSSTEQIYSDH